MNALHFILPPLVGALIGWITNRLAIRMLFRPRRPLRLGPYKLQGLIPRRQRELAERIGVAIEQELFSHSDIRAAIQDPAFTLDCERAIYRHVSRFTEEKTGVLPNVVGEAVKSTGLTARFERALVDEIAQYLPEILDDACAALEANTNIRAIITDKIERFESEKIEAIILQVARRELAAIEYAGALLGMMVGLLQVGVYLFF